MTELEKQLILELKECKEASEKRIKQLIEQTESTKGLDFSSEAKAVIDVLEDELDSLLELTETQNKRIAILKEENHKSKELQKVISEAYENLLKTPRTEQMKIEALELENKQLHKLNSELERDNDRLKEIHIQRSNIEDYEEKSIIQKIKEKINW